MTDLTILFDKEHTGKPLVGWSRLKLTPSEKVFKKIYGMPGSSIPPESMTAEGYGTNPNWELKEVSAARLGIIIYINSELDWNKAIAHMLMSLGERFKVVLYWH